MVKFLINWTKETEIVGGAERRYSLLQKVFPEAVVVSARSLAREKATLLETRKAVDAFLEQSTTKKDIVIKDAGVGGIKKGKAKTILFFGNPYQSLINKFPNSIYVANWKELVQAQKEDYENHPDFCIANSDFSQYDARLSDCYVENVINNGVDIDFWVPDETVKKKYVLWSGSCFKESVVGYSLPSFRVKLFKVYKRDKKIKEEMLKIYQGALCLFHNFPIEGNSNTVLEALSCGVPVFTKKCGLFWNKDADEVGGILLKRRDKMIRQINSFLQRGEKYNTREFLIKNELTANDYIKKVKECIKCIL